jgi:hypothetical protein
MTCPFCESEDIELVSPWGGQIITCQVRCRSCSTYFEAIRDEFAEGRSWTTSSADAPRAQFEEGRSWTTSSADAP